MKKLLKNSIDEALKPTLKALFDHFQNVLAHSNANRMAAQNIAIVFGPTLIQSPNAPSYQSIMTHNNVIHTLIDNYEQLKPLFVWTKNLTPNLLNFRNQPIQKNCAFLLAHPHKKNSKKKHTHRYNRIKTSHWSCHSSLHFAQLNGAYLISTCLRLSGVFQCKVKGVPIGCKIKDSQ